MCWRSSGNQERERVVEKVGRVAWGRSGMQLILLPRVRAHRCLDDVDDEVRDRAAMYLKVVNEQALADTYIREGGFGCQ